MSATASHSLAQHCAQPGVRLTQRGALDIIEVENEFARFAVTPFGATVLDYQPQGSPPLLWVSPQARFDGKKAIRGGIPVCWPWFGDYPEPGTGRSAHGFVRDRTWALDSITTTDQGRTQLRLSLADNAASRALWPHSFSLALLICVGDTLDLSLITTNPGMESFTLTEALHAYFAVDNAHGVSVSGLDGAYYLDKLQDYAGGRLSGALALAPPWDRVYQTTAARMVLADQHSRQVRITKARSNSTIVWNPGPDATVALGDMPDDGWQSMVCIEAGNALTEAVVVPPGGQHTLEMHIESI